MNVTKPTKSRKSPPTSETGLVATALLIGKYKLTLVDVNKGWLEKVRTNVQPNKAQCDVSKVVIRIWSLLNKTTFYGATLFSVRDLLW